MDIISALLIGIGSIVGVYMLINLIKGHHIPKALTIIHGTLVGIGFLSLIIFNLGHPEQAKWKSVALFILATLGGIYILYHDIKHEKVPLIIVFIHGAIALFAYACLILSL